MAQQASNLFQTTISVIPSGYKWTPEQAKKAAEHNKYIRVGGEKIGSRFLSGAKRSWDNADPEENRTVFQPQLRISGTPENIRYALTYAGFSNEQIDEFLNNVITKDNANTTMRNVVLEELARRQSSGSAKPSAKPFYDLNQIIWFADHVKSAIISNSVGQQKGTVSSPGRAGASESLAEKIANLKPGKVLDVSGMDLTTGKGVRTVNIPKTNRSGKYGAVVNGVYHAPIISNNFEAYRRAIELGYPGRENEFTQDIEIVRQALSHPRTQPTVAPTFGAKLAPVPQQPQAVQLQPMQPVMPVQSRTPGATIAPAPVFTAAVPNAVPRVASPVATVGGGNYPGIPPLGGLLRQ